MGIAFQTPFQLSWEGSHTHPFFFLFWFLFFTALNCNSRKCILLIASLNIIYLTVRFGMCSCHFITFGYGSLSVKVIIIYTDACRTLGSNYTVHLFHSIDMTLKMWAIKINVVYHSKNIKVYTKFGSFAK